MCSKSVFIPWSFLNPEISHHLNQWWPSSLTAYGVIRTQSVCKWGTFISYRVTENLNTLRPRRNRHHFADTIFKCIFVNENVGRPGDKPLSEPKMVRSLTHICFTWPQWVNTLRPRQNGRHFPHDIFKWIFLNENVWILINISLKFVPKGPINNIP